MNAGGGVGFTCFCGSGGKYSSGCLGRFGVTPGELLGRISGVIITTSSVWFFCAALLLNSRPRIGISPMPGIFCIVEFMVLFINPAIANVWPLFNSSSVSVRRVLSAGIRNPFKVIALLKSSVLTSGRTFRWTRSPTTVGVKVRRTPNSLNTTVIEVPPPEGCAIGIGNSPPARKLASLPLSATRFGSARL